MAINHRIPLLAAVGLLAVTTLGFGGGCAQPGPIATHRNTVGSLKASVSQLEYDNVNLRKQVAELKTESTRAENKLVQAEDEIQKRDNGSSMASRSSATKTTSTDDDDVPPPIKSPVRRSRSSRKPPAAQIPRIETRPDPGPGGIELGTDSSDPGPQASQFIDDGRWLPVAHGRGRGGSVQIR